MRRPISFTAPSPLALLASAVCFLCSSFHAAAQDSGSIQFERATFHASENDAKAVITILQTANTNAAASYRLSGLPATGQAPVRWTAFTNDIALASGANRVEVTLPIRNDKVRTPMEVISLTLSKTNGTAIASSALVITDDDGSEISFTLGDYAILETAGTLPVLLEREGDLSNSATLSVNQVSLSNSGATQIIESVPVTFPSGESFAAAQLPIPHDPQPRGDVTFELRLAGLPSNVIRGLLPTATLTILDAETEYALEIQGEVLRENEGTVPLTVIRRGSTRESGSVRLVTVDGSARKGVDFIGLSQVVQFKPGEFYQDVELTLLDNHHVDPPRTITIALEAPVRGTIGKDGRATIPLADDESQALPGGLDPGFSMPVDGFVASMARQSNGAILLAGFFTTLDGNDSLALIRTDATGRMDSTFHYQSSEWDYPRNITVEPDDRILLLFSQYSVQALNDVLVRLGKDGQFERQVARFPNFSMNRMALDASSRILLAGSFPDSTSLRRFQTNSQPDTAFNQKVKYAVPVRDMLPLPDGRLFLLADWNGPGLDCEGTILLNSDGAPDPSYQCSPLAGSPQKGVRLPDGSLLLANDSKGLFRQFPNGSMDLTITGAPYTNPADIKLFQTLADGRLLLGWTQGSGNSIPARTGGRLVRLFADGSVDPTFTADVNASPTVALELDDGSLLVADSNLQYVNGIAINGIARLRSDIRSQPASVRWNGSRFAIQNRTGIAQFPLFRTGSLDTAVTVQVTSASGTATSPGDFQPVDQTVSFAPGERMKLAEVAVSGAAPASTNRQFELRLAGKTVDAAGSAATIILLPETGVFEFETNLVSVSESRGFFSIGLRRSGAVGVGASVRVGIRLETAGTNDVSFTESIVRFPPGIETVSVTGKVTDDSGLEDVETFTLELSEPSAGFSISGFGTVQVAILDNDSHRPTEGLDRGASVLWETPEHKILLQGGFTRVHGRPSAGFQGLNVDGSLDASWKMPSFPPNAGIVDMDSAGRYILREAQANSSERVRYRRSRPDGTDDPEFQSTNIIRNLVADALNPEGGLSAMATPANLNGGYLGLRVVRLKTSGRVDGIATNATLYPTGNIRTSILPQEDGKTLIGGVITRHNPSTSEILETFFCVRVNANGGIDPSFHPVRAPANLQDHISSVVHLLPGGRIVVIQLRVPARDYSDRTLSLFDRDGNPAADFDFERSNIRSPFAAFDAPDGKLFVYARYNTHYFQVWRLNPNGTVDPSFSDQAIGLSPDASTSPYSQRILSDGRIVLSGEFLSFGGETRVRLAWLDPNGFNLPDMPLALESLPPTSDGLLKARLLNRLAGPVALDISPDLTAWAPGTPFQAPLGQSEILLPRNPASNVGFFRLRRP